MGIVLPIEDFARSVSEAAPCGVLDSATEAQIMTLDAAVKRGAKSGFQPLRTAAEGLFRGGRINDLGNPNGDTMVEVKPVRHLKAAMALTLASLDIDGFSGFCDGLVLIERLVSTHWQEVHPVATDDPEDPFIGRVTSLSPLSIVGPETGGDAPGAVFADDSYQIAERLYRCALIKSDRHGELTVRDCVSPWAKQLKLVLPPGEDRSPEFIHEVRLASTDQLPGLVLAARAAENAAISIDRAFAAVPGAFKPKLGHLMLVLRSIGDVLEDKLSSPALSSGANAAGSSSVQTAIGSSGAVSSREEAIRKIIEAAEFFRRNEPSSPIPLLLDRVKRIAGMNFTALLKEFAFGEEEFRKLAGGTDPSQSESKS